MIVNQSESPILAVNYILTTKSQLKSFIQPAPGLPLTIGMLESRATSGVFR